MNINTNNQVSTGEIIFTEGNKPEGAFIVLRGKIRVFNGSFSTVMGVGSLLAVDDYQDGVHAFSAVALEDTVVYAFIPENKDTVMNLLIPHKEYCGPSVYSGIKLINELDKQFISLYTLAKKLYSFLQEGYDFYLGECRRVGCNPELIPEIKKMESCDGITVPEDASLELYREYSRLPYETIKPFFTASAMISAKLLYDLSESIQLTLDSCTEIADYVYSGLSLLCGSKAASLYKNLLVLDLDAKKHGIPSQQALIYATRAYSLARETIDFFKEKTGRGPLCDSVFANVDSLKSKIEKGIDIRTNEKSENQDAEIDVAAEIANLNGSAEQIMKFVRYPDDSAADFREVLEKYIACPDRESQDDGMRMLRKKLSEHFYVLYGQAFGAFIGNGRALPRAVELFLDYGYVSEKLLEQWQLEALLKTRQVIYNIPCTIYTMRQWLTAIYNGEKEPSRNDLGQDYGEVLRELRKQGKINEDKENEMKNSPLMRFDYELKNLFMKVNRLCNGQLTTFVPILHAEQLIGDMNEAFVSSKKLNDLINEISQLDYSLFYRETLFVDQAKGIEREVIQKEVFPDIILCPTVGTNIMMWQEITGRKRDTKGRFFAPVFTYYSLRDMLVKALGEFRWALCKTIQGVNWNNIQYQSLTSAYTDYIQFYRKNRELSDEKKEKLKLQIQRGRNALSKIFTMDYEMWIKSESEGAVKLNKVAREMLATYCPFKSEVRQNLLKQPIFEEAYAKYNRERVKKLRELETRYKNLEKAKGELPQELVTTLRYYKEL